MTTTYPVHVDARLEPRASVPPDHGADALHNLGGSGRHRVSPHCSGGSHRRRLGRPRGGVCASLLGLLLKALFFNPWLLLGVLIDLGVLLGVAYWPWH